MKLILFECPPISYFGDLKAPRRPQTMWFCKLCKVSFVTESVEQHVKPKNGGIKVYNCGECPFTAEGFEDIALHCINLGHEPTKVFKGLNYDEYLPRLFASLEEIMCLKKPTMCPVPTKETEVSINSDQNIAWSPSDSSEVIANKDPLAYDPAEFRIGQVGNEINEKNQMDLPTGLVDHNPKSPLRAPVHEKILKEQIDMTGNTTSAANNAKRLESRGEKSTKSSTFASSSSRPASIPRKTYPCSYCPKLSYMSSHAKYHERTHTGKKLFPCPTCEKVFRYQSDLKIHKRIHSDEKPFECSTCGKQFIQNAHLTQHELIHTGEKPFECSTCGKQFTQNAHLTRHELIHTSEKPFECSICGKQFIQNANLTRHELIHTSEKPFECLSCGMAFGRKDNKEKHKAVCHGILNS